MRYQFALILKYYTDQMEIDSLAKVFEVKTYNDLLKVAGTKAKDELKGLNLKKGEIVPEFFVANVLDSLVSIRDYKDKVLYVNFWATWCGPCIKNMPALNKMIVDFENRSEIEFLNICLESDKEKWNTMISKFNIGGTNLFAEGNWNKKLRANFNIESIPDYVIIDKGNIFLQNYANKAPLVKEQLDQIIVQ